MIELPFRANRPVRLAAVACMRDMRYRHCLWDVVVAQTGHRRARIADECLDRAHGFGPMLAIQRALK